MRLIQKAGSRIKTCIILLLILHIDNLIMSVYHRNGFDFLLSILSYSGMVILYFELWRGRRWPRILITLFCFLVIYLIGFLFIFKFHALSNWNVVSSHDRFMVIIYCAILLVYAVSFVFFIFYLFSKKGRIFLELQRRLTEKSRCISLLPVLILCVGLIVFLKINLSELTYAGMRKKVRSQTMKMSFQVLTSKLHDKESKHKSRSLEERILSTPINFTSNGDLFSKKRFLTDNGKILDPWGTPYRLTLKDDVLEVVSAGPNKTFGTWWIFNDDIHCKGAIPNISESQNREQKTKALP